MSIAATFYFATTYRPGHDRRIWVALAAAVFVHCLVLLVPAQLPLSESPDPNRLQIELNYQQMEHKLPATLERAAPAVEKPEQQARPVNPDTIAPQATPSLPSLTTPPPTSQDQPAEASPPENVSADKTAREPIEEPERMEGGAKSRSTVFDPRLRQQVEAVRNQVQKFETLDTEYATRRGTFIQRGNSCWEFRKLLPEGNESNVTQRFNINCSNRNRSKKDIERLAEKYGIP